MPRHRLIENYLDHLRVLPVEMVDELTDGLIESYDHHRRHGRAPDDAARATITEFGPPEDVIAAFDQIAPGRRVSRLLLATGPLAGLCWGTAVLTTHAWTWPIPTWTAPAFGVALVTVIALLLTAARVPRRRARRAAPFGAGGLALLDTFAVIEVLSAAPDLSWPLRLAILISLVRACLTARTLRVILTR